MLMWLAEYLTQFYSGFNVFSYLTFRSILGVLTALMLSLYFGPKLIRRLQLMQIGQTVRDDGPESHLLTKTGTPTMGGFLIIVSMIFSTLLWSNLSNGFVWAVLGVTAGFGALGAIDDYMKLTKRTHHGISAKAKFLGLTLISLAAIYWIIQTSHPTIETHLAIPFFKNILIDLGYFFYPFAIVVLVGSSNAVNLTDGLDGLATVPVIIAAACFGLIAYLVGNSVFSSYLQIVHVPGSGELAIFCGAMIGACLGFLWFNAPPASVFMGDTGSLAMGGALGTISVVTKHEIVLVIIGGLFVIETLSVIIQVGYFKLTGKRVFLMAPIHHHFEKKGWAESTIVIRFWIISIVLALIGLSSLKLR